MNADLLAAAPEVIEFLRNWSFDIETYKTVANWQLENPNADSNDAALWWLSNNEAVWSQWLTDEAAAAVSAALEAGEAPSGWPTA